MKVLEKWKEGLFILAYFGFLAVFIPKAQKLGWGLEGTCFCIFGGLLLVLLAYFVVKFTAEWIAERREAMAEFFQYMGAGAMKLETRGVDGVIFASTTEVDALLATNPYAVPELFDDDKYTHLLPSVSTDNNTRLVDESELDREIGDEAESSGGRVAAIIGENPRRRLHLADNFQPDANEPLTTGVFVVGIPGSGKTVTLALFLEQYITQFHLAVVIFDIAGDWKSIVEDGLCPRGLIAMPEAMPSMTHVVKHRMQAVIDLQQCRRPGEAFINYELAGQLIAKTLKDLMNAQSAIDPHKRLPCLIGLDETHLWAPQNPPSYLSPVTAKDLLDTLTVVATTGRKYGVVPFFAAQRIPKVHKDIIAGCETRIFGKADLDNDIKRYREYVSPDVISDQSIRSLSKGRMVVCMGGKRLIVQFYQRESHHISHTPGITQALNNLVGRIPPELLASITRPAKVAPPAPAAPAHATRIHASSTGGFTTIIPIQLRRALKVYRPGMSHRDLARAMNLDKETAIELMKQLKTRRLIGEAPADWDTNRESIPARVPGATPELDTTTVLPVRTEQKPQPTLKDAITCWNELVQAGQNPSRNNLQQALIAKGFDCKENWARKFYEGIKDMLKDQPKASAGG